MGQPAEAENFADRRALERLPTALRAKVFPGGADCVIKDYNERGARLRFAERPAMGDHLVLVVWSSGLAFEAVVRWRSEEHVGVQFLHKRDFRRPVPAELAAIRALWQKRRPHLSRRELKAQSQMIQKRSAVRGYWNS